MKFILGLIFLLTCSHTTSEVYRYPKKIEIDTNCNGQESEVAEIKRRHGVSPECSTDLAVRATDLNGDGRCEYYVTYDEGAVCLPETDIVKIENGNVISIASLSGYPEGVSSHSESVAFATPKNGYPRLINYLWGGIRGNPIMTAFVLAYDGNTYVCEFCVENSQGGYADLARTAYDRKNYALAEIYYWNVYAINGERKLSDANNLALTYIKRGQYQKAVSLLERHISLSDSEIVSSEASPCYGAGTRNGNVDCVLNEERLTKLKSAAIFNKNMALDKLRKTVPKQ